MTSVGWEYTIYPRDMASTLVAAGVVNTQELACWVAGEILRTNDHAFCAIVQRVAFEFNNGEPDPRTRDGIATRLKGLRSKEGDTVVWAADVPEWMPNNGPLRSLPAIVH